MSVAQGWSLVFAHRASPVCRLPSAVCRCALRHRQNADPRVLCFLFLFLAFVLFSLFCFLQPCARGRIQMHGARLQQERPAGPRRQQRVLRQSRGRKAEGLGQLAKGACFGESRASVCHFLETACRTAPPLTAAPRPPLPLNRRLFKSLRPPRHRNAGKAKGRRVSTRICSERCA